MCDWKRFDTTESPIGVSPRPEEFTCPLAAPPPASVDTPVMQYEIRLRVWLVPASGSSSAYLFYDNHGDWGPSIEETREYGQEAAA